MDELTMGVSWLGVVSGAVVAFLVGWAWYSEKLFGLKWAKDNGVTMGEGDPKLSIMPMLVNFIGLLLMSWFVGVTAVSSALLTVLLGTVAFTVLAYSNGMFAQDTAYVRNVNAGYWIVALIVMIGAQAIF